MRSPLTAIACALGRFASSVATLALTMTVSAGSAGARVLQPLSAARPILPLRNSRREPIPYLHVFRLELDARGFRLCEQERGKVLLGHALADHLLQDMTEQDFSTLLLA